ncbi:MAG: amidohydrolase [Rhodothermales bacterium]
MTSVFFRQPILVVVAALLFSACSTTTPDSTADLVLRGGKVATVNPDQPYAEAVAVKADTILFVGSNADVEAFIGAQTEVIELEGRLATPGFIEGHGHYMGLGAAKMNLDLTTARTWDEIVRMVGDAAGDAEPGEWIVGRGWHQEKWDEVPEGAVEGNPVHASLSAVSPDNPVYLGHASGHAAFVNREAMRLGGVSAETPNPPGGEILKDVRGEPTGLLRETAQSLVSRARAEARASMTQEERVAEAREQARLAADEALRHGITSFQDAGSGFGTISFLKVLADEGALPVRLYVMIRESNDALREDLSDHRYESDFLTVRSIKRTIDGALGAHGAWLLEPYADLPSSSGLNTSSIEDLEELADMAAAAGFQLNVHAIGDRANREALDVFARHTPGKDLRWRVEHAQHLHPDDIPRFAELGVIPAMQAIHATSDAPWVLRRLGEERAESGAYMWQSLWQSGAVVTNGTDVPVEPIDPIASYYATGSRRLADGSVFYADERLTREQALQSYTLNNAFAAFEEEIKGSLEVGKLADITVFDRDILTVPDEDVQAATVTHTIVGGKVLYRAGGN